MNSKLWQIDFELTGRGRNSKISELTVIMCSEENEGVERKFLYVADFNAREIFVKIFNRYKTRNNKCNIFILQYRILFVEFPDFTYWNGKRTWLTLLRQNSCQVSFSHGETHCKISHYIISSKPGKNYKESK